MVNYLILMKLTAAGAARIDEMPFFVAEVRNLVSARQGTVHVLYATLGEVDFVLAAELPDDESAMMLAADLVKSGQVTTTSMKAFALPVVEAMWRGRQ